MQSLALRALHAGALPSSTAVAPRTLLPSHLRTSLAGSFFPLVRLQNLRNRLQEVEAAAAVQAEGLRKRGAGAAGAAAAADDEDERDVKTHGFPLWQLLLVAVVFFLLGRLSNSWV